MHAFFVTSTNFGVGLTSISLGLIRALENRGLKVGFCKPIAQSNDRGQHSEYSTELVARTLKINSPQPLSRNYVEQRLSNDELDILLEDAINLFQQASIDKDVVVIEGMVPTAQLNYATYINAALAQSLNADVILAAAPEEEYENFEEFIDSIEIQAHSFGGPRDSKVIGVVINKVKDPDIEAFKERLVKAAPQLFKDDFKILGCNPWRDELNAPRLQDITQQLNAQIISAGELETRRVQKIILCARAVPDTIPLFEPGVLIVTPGDRDDIIMATSLAAMNGIPLAGLLLCSNFPPDPRIMTLCHAALESGLPVLSVKTGSYDTATNLIHIDKSIAVDDQDRANQVTEFIAEQLDQEWLFQRCGVVEESRLSPPAFRYQLVKRAQEANKRIVLPEGNEPRTIHAAIICHQRGIARCVLLAKPEEVHNVVKNLGLQLPDDLEIIDPNLIRQRYVEPLVELRKNKGMTPLIAEQSLGDTVVLGTMMLATDDVDGLVSGAIHTTANTVRPALQLIKTASEYNLVSSIFFMLLPDQVLVYGDCAINPTPTAEELADIAIQSAESAASFGITPRVAMISYSTGASGGGEDVEKVREATELAKQKRPDLLIDGPLQYDAAAIESVGKQKAPNSPVAGKATVFIFPDLNTGNTTYKAVQRSAQVISVGPMLQGLRKPVNDLSRGALVEDIVFTIALTAIQAQATKKE